MALQKLNQDEEIHLTFTVSQILENWVLDDNIQLSLLGLEDKIKPRHLYKYRNGDISFEFDQNLITRSTMILGIHESLGTTYPSNRDYGAIWLKRPVKKFKHKTPLELMLSGETGMRRVWYFLDCTQTWQD